MGLSVTARILLVLSAICLAASAGIVMGHANQFSFALLHRPLHVAKAKPAAGAPAQLPRFDVRTHISATELNAGETQSADLTVTSDRDADALVMVWYKSPANKQVFRSPEGHVEHFAKGVSRTFEYDYAPTADLPKGKYQMSEIISSVDTQTDYYVKYDVAEFSLQ